MVICDAHIFRSLRRPDETDAPLIIDPDRMLAFAVAFQGFKPVARRGFQVIKRCCGMDRQKFTRHYTLHICPPAPFWWLSGQKEAAAHLVSKALDHDVT